MDRRSFLKAIAAGTWTAVSPVPSLLWSEPGRAQGRPETLDEILEPIRRDHRRPALAGAVVRGASLVAVGAVGVRRTGASERAQMQDSFHLGSCTKSMTATVIAMLVEQGKLSWEATVADTFPDLAGTIHRDYHKVTVSELLMHRGGLPDDRSPEPVVWPRIRALRGPLPEQRRALLELVLSRPPAAPPGSRFQYSNAGYAIAGAFAEQAVGESWEQLIRRMLFTPLGMTTAGFGPPLGSQPWGHTQVECQPRAPGPNADNPQVIGPAGTVHCAMADWAQYAILHLRGANGEGGLLVTSESFQVLHRDVYHQGYAMGWGLERRDWAGGFALTHAGTNTLWYADIWIAPARNAALMAATNCGGDEGFRACDATVAALIKRFL